MAQTLSNLPIGAKVKFGKHQVNTEAAMPIIWTIVAKNHPGYPANAITLHAEKIIDLRCFDAREPNNPNSDRRDYGNNRYSISNIDQWLNKDSPPGAWYVEQHTYDQAPDVANVNYLDTEYVTRPGFLYHFSTEEKNAILFTSLRVVKPSVDGGGYEDITRKVFLPSTTEVGLANEGGTAEGTAWGFYTSDAARSAYLTAQAFNNTLSESKPSTIDEAWFWWLRTPTSSSANAVLNVRPEGTLHIGAHAHTGNRGIRPALNLLSSLLVSDTTDADGCYTFVWNTPPPVYIAREIKDRVAIGDNCFYMDELEDGRILLTPAPDSIIEPGTDINKALLQPIEDRVVWLMNRIFDDITSNPFMFAFDDLTGLIVTGVWNKNLARIEC